MIVVMLQGGLGNQMFEYATAYSFAKKNNRELKLSKNNLNTIDHDDFRLDKLSISYTDDVDKMPFVIRHISSNRFLRRILKKTRVSDLKVRNWFYVTQLGAQYRENICKDDNCNYFLDGYWQNPLFFIDYKSEISREFMPSFQLSSNSKKWAELISNCESVSIHIRRGDYLNSKNVDYLIKDEYYIKSIDFIKHIKPNARFFVFSDDKQWCKANFKNFEIVELNDNNNSDIEEMYLMSLCKNNINANSSFSWWAAFLNENEGKIVINPERPWNPEMIPSQWYIGVNSGINKKEPVIISKV